MTTLFNQGIEYPLRKIGEQALREHTPESVRSCNDEFEIELCDL
jgi:hypothetical protein